MPSEQLAFHKSFEYFNKYNPFVQSSPEEAFDQKMWSMIQSVSSRDIYMHHLYSKALNSNSRKLNLELMKELQKIMIIEETFANILDVSLAQLLEDQKDLTTKYVPTDFDCLRELIGEYETSCNLINETSRKFIKYFVRECENPT